MQNMITDKTKKKIFVLGSGGTIAGLAASPVDFMGYTAGAAGVDSLLNRVPEIDELAELETEDFCGIASENATPEVWLNLARRAEQILSADDVDGLVVTSGTDTLEEMAYFLNLVLDTAKPVVVVGAMRPLSAYGTDGPVNLYNAVAVAANPQSEGKGVLVVMNDTIISARGVNKQDSCRLNTMGGGDFGTLGYVVAGNVHFSAAPCQRHTHNSEFHLAEIRDLPPVDIFYMSAGVDARLLSAMADLGACGVVLAGFGNGTFSDSVGDQLHDLIDEGLVCVITSRCQTGLVHVTMPGLVAGGDLSPQKARVLLMLALAVGKTTEEIERCFTEY